MPFNLSRSTSSPIAFRCIDATLGTAISTYNNKDDNEEKDC